MGRNSRCPSCKEYFLLDEEVDEGQTVNCPNCYAELKVRSVSPPEVEEMADFREEEVYYEDDEDDGHYPKRRGGEDW